MPTLIEVICRFCQQPFHQPLKIYNKGVKYRAANPKSELGLYCGVICVKKWMSVKYATALETQCAICNKPMHVPPRKRKSSLTNVFTCSNECKARAISIDFKLIPLPHTKDNGRRSYRNRAIAYYGSKCMRCGYTDNEQMIDVDHINGDRSNNHIENLQVLCVWCHALKTRKIWDGRLESRISDVGSETYVKDTVKPSDKNKREKGRN